MTNAFFAFFASNAGAVEQNKGTLAGIVTLQGMLTVFLVLALIWAAIEVMHLILHGRKAEKKAEGAKSAPVAAAPVKESAIAAAPAASEDEGAIIAAITAAIIAARAEEGNNAAFRVVSFQRVGRASAQKRF